MAAFMGPKGRGFAQKIGCIFFAAAGWCVRQYTAHYSRGVRRRMKKRWHSRMRMESRGEVR